MLADTSDHTVITVRAEEGVGDVKFVFETDQVATSADELRKVLIDGEETGVDEFRQFREVSDWVDRWGGRMIVATQDDHRTVIKLVLKRHHWTTDPRPAGAPQAKESGTQK